MPMLPPNRLLSGRRLNRRWRGGQTCPLPPEGNLVGSTPGNPGCALRSLGYVLFDFEADYPESKCVIVDAKTNLSYRAVHIREIPDYIRMDEGQWWRA